MMDQMEKIRLDQTKMIKVRDDQMNRTQGFIKSKNKFAQKNADRQGADQLPFYERLREKSNFLEA